MRKSMKKRIRKKLKIILGYFLIIAGVIGLFLPIMQGVAMIIAGILLVSKKHGKRLIKKLKSYRNRLKKKY